MRQAIESAPKDQEAIILEDDASGIFDVAHWSPEAGEWISENGEPSKITPTHWHPLPHDPYLQQSNSPSHVGRARRRFAAFSAAFIATALTGLYFRAEVATWVTGNAGQQDIVSAIDGSNLQLRAPAAVNSAQSLEQEREKTAALALAATAARQEQAASNEQRRQAIQEERARGAALANELAATRHEIEVNAAQLIMARDDAAQFKSAERAAAEQQKERESAETLSRELAMARREIEANAALLTKERDDAAQFKQTAEKMATEQQRERESAEALSRELAIARREIQANAALLTKARDDAAKFKQTAEQMTAELQQERDRAKAISRGLTMAHRAIDTRAAPEPIANGPIAQATLAAETTASVQAVAADAQSNPEAARLMARARTLLAQGNVGAARIVLERAAETGSAQASFMLAETYDPVILSIWGTYGTRGEATKARELYAKALAGGILEAKNRFDALSQ